MARLWGLPWIVWLGICLAVATLYFFVWPSNKVTSGASNLRFIILRYAHSLVWMLLAFFFLLRGTKTVPVQLANVTALLALFVYIIFIITFITARP
jgi:hypothetical protein